MSIQVTQQNTAYKKPKPGLKQAGGAASTNLKSAISNLKVSSNTQTGSTKSTANSTASTTSLQKNTLAQTVSRNLSTSSNYNIFSDGKYESYGNRVGGTRSLWVSDYRRDNIRNDFLAYSDNIGLTPRGQARQDRMIDKYFEMRNRMYQKMMEQQKCMDISNLFNGISQNILGAGNITTEIIKYTQANKNADVEVSSGVGSEVKSTVNELNSADSSTEIQEGLANLDNQISSKTKLSESIDTQIQSDSEAKTQAENELADIKTGINDKKTEIRGFDTQITKLESQLSSAQAKGQDTSAIQGQIDELKQKKEAANKELKTLQQNEKDKETEISTLETTISNNNSEKEKLDNEITSLNNAKTQFTTKQARLEKSEKSDLDKMHNNLKKLSSQILKESDENKKEELRTQYRNLANQFNAALDNTTVKHNYEKATAA